MRKLLPGTYTLTVTILEDRKENYPGINIVVKHIDCTGLIVLQAVRNSILTEALESRIRDVLESELWQIKDAIMEPETDPTH